MAMSDQNRSLLTLALIVAATLGGSRLLQVWQAGEQGQVLRDLARPGDIVMLSSTTCVYCARARSWLSEERVPHRECFIERDAACLAQYQAQLAPGTPTFLVRGQRIVGFDRARIVAALQPR